MTYSDLTIYKDLIKKGTEDQGSSLLKGHGLARVQEEEEFKRSPRVVLAKTTI